MFEKLFRSRRGAGASKPSVPEGCRVYAIGDIHGRLDLLAKLHGLIEEDARDFSGARKVLIYLGDYIDRGMQSKEVVDLLLDAPLDGFEHVHLKGNHEQALLDFADGEMLSLDWIAFGGDATFYSYGVGLEGPRTGIESHAALLENFNANLPDQHAVFYRGLALTHVEGDYFFAHAGVRPGVPLDEQTETDLLWIRHEFLHSDKDFGKIVVHGHSIMSEPEVKSNRIGIDTGAYATGRLSCLVLEEEERRFLAT